MKYLMILLSRSKRSYTFDTIPASLFFEILDSQDVSKLGKGEKGVKVWDQIYKDYVKFYGINKEYKKYLDKMKRAIILLDEAYNHKKPGNKLLAELIIEEAQALITKGNTEQIEMVVASISMSLGFQIRMSEITAKEFFAYLKALQKKHDLQMNQLNEIKSKSYGHSSN